MKNIYFIFLLVFIVSCGGYSSSPSSSDSDTDTSALEATLSSIQENIFTPTCALSGCHSSASASGQLSLANGESFTNLVDVDAVEAPSLKRVGPTDPDNSYLIHKLEGTHTSVGGSGSQMPKNGTPLSDDEINKIREWIENGAEND